MTRSDRAALARGGLLNLGGAGTYAVLTFALGVAVTRGLGAGGAGVFFTAIGLFTILTIAVQLGADVGVMRTISRDAALGRAGHARRTVATALGPVVAAGTLVGVGLLLLAPAIGDVLVRGDGSQTLTTYLRVLAPFLPLAAASAVVLAATRGLGASTPFVAVEQVGKSASRPLLAVAAIGGGLGSAAVALAWAVPIALAFVGGLAWLGILLRNVERAAPGDSEEHDARAFWRFTAPRGAAAFFQVGILWFDVLLIAALASAAEAGIYAAATRYATVGTFALQAVILTVGPQISALFAVGDRARAQGVYQTSAAWLTAVSWPLYLSLAIFAPLFLGVFGPGFQRGETVLVILSLVMLLQMATGPVTVVLLMCGKSWWNLANAATALSVSLGLNLLLIPRAGMTGAAVACAATIVVARTAPLLQLWLLLRMQPLSRGLGLVAGAAVMSYGGLGLTIRILFGASLPSFLLYAGAATALYAALLWSARASLHLPVLQDVLRVRASRPIAAEPA